MAGTFTARYRGACAAGCEDPIEPDDEVTYDGADGLVHAVCPDRVEERRGAVCPMCFIELPLTKICPDCA